MNPILITLLAVVFVVLSARLLDVTKQLRDERRRARETKVERERWHDRWYSARGEADALFDENHQLRTQVVSLKEMLRNFRRNRLQRPPRLP